jgi:hypothetical protein
MRIFFLITGLLIAITGCNMKSAEEIVALEKKRLDSIEKAFDQKKLEDSIKQAAEKEKTSALLRESIKVQKYYTDSPNSAGGVDVNIVWKNLSKKTVKYARFTVVPYNAVGDIVASEIGGETSKVVKATGPVESGKVDGYGTVWSCLWYNHQIKYMKITGIEIEYMDGSIISSNDKSVIEEVLPKK